MFSHQARSLLIVCKLFLMLPAIKLYHKVLFNTGEIRNVLPYRMLATETVPVELLSPQRTPKQSLDICHVTA